MSVPYIPIDHPPHKIFPKKNLLVSEELEFFYNSKKNFSSNKLEKPKRHDNTTPSNGIITSKSLSADSFSSPVRESSYSPTTKYNEILSTNENDVFNRYYSTQTTLNEMTDFDAKIIVNRLEHSSTWSSKLMHESYRI